MKTTRESARLLIKMLEFLPVLSLSVACPQHIPSLSAACQNSKSKNCLWSIRSLSVARPTLVRSLSTQKHKKRTTPFGGMARPYYSLPAHPIPSFLSLFHSSTLRCLSPIKFSQEYCK